MNYRNINNRVLPHYDNFDTLDDYSMKNNGNYMLSHYDGEDRIMDKKHRSYLLQQQDYDNLHEDYSINTTTTMESLSPSPSEKLLPCRSFISTGTCCYGNKCNFIHDLRMTSTYFKAEKTSRSNLKKFKARERLEAQDSFFWPPLNHQSELYSVPLPASESKRERRAHFTNNDISIFSMWNNFIDIICLPTTRRSSHAHTSNISDISNEIQQQTVQSTSSSNDSNRNYNGIHNHKHYYNHNHYQNATPITTTTHNNHNYLNYDSSNISNNNNNNSNSNNNSNNNNSSDTTSSADSLSDSIQHNFIHNPIHTEFYNHSGFDNSHTINNYSSSSSSNNSSSSNSKNNVDRSFNIPQPIQNQHENKLKSASSQCYVPLSLHHPLSSYTSDMFEIELDASSFLNHIDNKYLNNVQMNDSIRRIIQQQDLPPPVPPGAIIKSTSASTSATTATKSNIFLLNKYNEYTGKQRLPIFVKICGMKTG